MVLKIVRDFYEKQDYEKVILVSGDGDYSGLVKFLQEKNKIESVLSPNNKCSILIKRTNVKITYIDTQKSILSTQKEKAPNKDKTLPGSFP